MVEVTRKDYFLESSERTTLDFRLLVPRTVRE